MPRFLLYSLGALLFYSCNPKEQTIDTTSPSSTGPLEAVQEEPADEQKPAATDSANFVSAFNAFFQALQTSDTATINQFIHPQYGLWVIEQPGAMPKMTFVTDISNFKREYQERSFFTVKDEVKECNLQQETWPTFDCADMNYDAGQSGYSKDGCFVSGPDKFIKSGYWNYADLPMAQVKQIQSTLPYVQQSVLHTATSFEFHFGYIGGHWRLLFAKLIYPCSA